MNCHEVMELMQRHLDQDLNDAEHEAMMAHLQQCPDCAEMFSKLLQLSQELASLPKVTPPFSLVDSILPQLAEIDKVRDAEGNTPALSPAAGASAAVIPLATERPRRFRSAWSVAATGGIVAAGLLLALFIRDMDGTKVADEGPLMSTGKATLFSRSTESQQSASAGASADSNTAAPRSASPSGDTARSQKEDAAGGTAAEQPAESAEKPEMSADMSDSGTNEKSIAQNVQIPGDSAASSGPQAYGGSGTAASNGSASHDRVVPETPKAENFAQAGIDPSTESVSAGNTEASRNDASDSGAGAGGGATAEQSQMGIAASSDQEAPATSEETPAGQEAKEGSRPHSQITSDKSKIPPSGQFGIAAQPAEQLVSEDGVLVADVDTEHRRIVVTTADDKRTQMFVTDSWGEHDTPKLVGWKGSAQLTYSVTNKDGKTKTMVIDIAKNTESLVQP